MGLDLANIVQRRESTMTKMMHGRAHGKTIEFDEDLGIPDGQEVRVTVELLPSPEAGQLPPGEGIRRAFGAWAEGAEDLDKFLEWNREQRKVGRRRIDD
jgi:hypothetical protein